MKQDGNTWWTFGYKEASWEGGSPYTDRSSKLEPHNERTCPYRADRPKLTLKRKSPVALPEDADLRVAKNILPSKSRIEEIE